MMRRAVLIVSMVIIAAGGPHAQVGSQFDTAKPVTLKGALAGLVIDAGASFLLINGGPKEAPWALLGDDFNALLREGWKIKGLPIGQEVTATGYYLRTGANAMALMPPDPSAALAAAFKAGRLVHGIDVTFADGTKLRLGPAK